MRLFEGQADGSFTDTSVRLEGEPMLWADLDNDGHLDIVATTRFGLPFPWIWWNQGGTNYLKETPQVLAIPGYSGTSIRLVSAADHDADGDLDLLVAYGGEAPMRLLSNDGGRIFSDTGIQFPESNGATSAWLDADGDGDLDLLGADAGSSTVLYRNEGNHRFSKMDSGLPKAYGPATWADFDLDGDPDVLIGAVSYEPHRAAETRIYFNDGTGRFTNSGVTLPALTASKVAVADFDGDSDIDFMLSAVEIWSAELPIRRFFRNDLPASTTTPTAPTTTPTAPTNLSVQLVGNRTTLRWTAVGPFLSSNVRVGTQPGGCDVMSPLSNPAGRRLVPAMGNAQLSSQWYLAGLKPGTYYWSVQSVDAAFRGSPFAEEMTFVVPETATFPTPPEITELPHLFTTEDTGSRSSSFQIGPASSLPDLTVTALSSNLLLAPLSTISFAGEGTNRTLTFTPAADQSGTSLITVRVTDAAGQSASSSFLLTVDPVNDAPQLAPIPNQTTHLGFPSLIVPFDLLDVDSTPSVTAFSSNPDIVGATGIEFIQTSPTNRALRITTPANVTGSAIITVTAADEAASTSVQFVVSALPPLFVPGETSLDSSSSGSLKAADFDADGKLDLLLLDADRDKLFLSRNLGGSRFAVPGQPFTISAFAHTTTLADRDDDGDIDIVVSGGGLPSFALRNDGGNVFTRIFSAGSLGPVLDAGAVGDWGDVDNDGDPDLVYSLTGNNEMGLLLNEGGQFTQSKILPRASGQVALGDFDADGILDVALSGTYAQGRVTNSVFRGMGGGVFLPSTIPLDQAASGPIGWADIDSDGRLDLWHLQAITADRRLLIYRGLPDQGLAAPAVIPLAVVNYNEFHWADFDGDGDLDFATEVYLDSIHPRFETSENKGLALFRNVGGLAFAPIGQVDLSAAARYMSVGDFDGDGTVDLTAHQNGSRVGTLLNRMSAPNPPPGAPHGLKAEVDGSSVRLSWNRAMDFNQPNGLTYNVRVGTRPNSGDVLQSLSLTNGSRLLADFGNAGVRTNAFLTNLVGETFYWSVQAVDNGFIGGPFAQEQSFVLDLPGNEPPSIGEVSDRTIAEDSSVLIPFTVVDDRTPPDKLRLRAFADDPFLMPSAELVLGGSGTNRTLTIRPSRERAGTTAITIEVTDAVGFRTVRTFLVTVTPVNDPPIGQDQVLILAEDSSLTFGILASDTEGDSLSYELVSGPRYGRLGGTPPQLTYWPVADFFGNDACVFRIIDANGGTATERITFVVTPVPEASDPRMSVRFLSDRTPVLKLNGEPFQDYVIETSEDLRTWTPLETFFSEDGVVEFIGTLPSPGLSRFYRARSD